MKRLLTLLLAAVISAASVFTPVVPLQAAVTVDTTKTAGASAISIVDRSAVAVNVPADTSEDTLATITVPAGAMGPNGVLRITTVWSWTNSANNKTPRVRFGGASGTQYLNAAFTTTAGLSHQVVLANRAATNSQVGFPNNTIAYSSSSNPATTSTVDTTASTTIVITGQKASSGETMTLESYLVELIPGS